MKVQRNAHLHKLSLIREHENYKLVQGRVDQLPEIIDYGTDGPWTFLVLEDLGLDVGKVYKKYGRFLPPFLSQVGSGMVGSSLNSQPNP